MSQMHHLFLGACAYRGSSREYPIVSIHSIALEEAFSETGLPVYGIIGNSISTTTHSRKPYMYG